MSKEFHERALNYHRGARPGKIYVSSHKSIHTHQGLSLAYTPGVAAPVPDSVLQAYQIDSLSYGADYIIPKPFDPRLINTVPKAIFEAAVSSGVSCLT